MIDRRDDRFRLAALVHDLGQGARSARRPDAAALERRDRRAADRPPIPKVQPILVDLEADAGLPARAARRQGSRLARRRRQSAEPARRRRRPDRGDRTARCCSASSTTSPSASARSPVQTRIDLRSVSRVGRHDFGANARRIDRFAAAVQDVDAGAVALTRGESAPRARARRRSTTRPRATRSSRWASVDRLAARDQGRARARHRPWRRFRGSLASPASSRARIAASRWRRWCASART